MQVGEEPEPVFYKYKQKQDGVKLLLVELFGIIYQQPVTSQWLWAPWGTLCPASGGTPSPWAPLSAEGCRSASAVWAPGLTAEPGLGLPRSLSPLPLSLVCCWWGRSFSITCCMALYSLLCARSVLEQSLCLVVGVVVGWNHALGWKVTALDLLVERGKSQPRVKFQLLVCYLKLNQRVIRHFLVISAFDRIPRLPVRFFPASLLNLF